MPFLGGGSVNASAKAHISCRGEMLQFLFTYSVTVLRKSRGNCATVSAL